MVPLGLFPVLAATVKLILIQTNGGECLRIGPIPGAVHSRGVLADKHPFVHSGRKEKRDVECEGRETYYPHPNRTHCCMLCHKGHYVAQHCESEDKTSTCKPCPKGSFNDWETFAEKCRGCQHCRASLGHVVLTNCSSTKDTVCGCASNHYRTSPSSEAICQPCSACHNGTVLKECSEYSDTICRCHSGFFLHPQKRSCSPCNSCEAEECKKECGVTDTSRSPPNSTDLTPIFSGLVVVLVATILLLTLKRFIKPPVRKKLLSTFRMCRPEQQSSPDDPQLPQVKVQVTSIPQESSPGEKLLPTTAVPAPPNTQGLPDCIPPAGETPIPDSPEFLYAVVENVPFSQWKEFVRRLGLTDNAIGRIQVEEWNVRDAQYKMLRHWRQQMGQRATVERMSSVLKEMELSGCSEAIQEMLSRQA